MLKFIVMLSCIFFFVGSVFSQPEGAETKFINGKEFYLHKVKSGSTIYGIHKLYNVGIEDILSANPTAKNG
ncbi:MAG: LysM peptidoglycan-binding domain-containing protein, partial [Crocinitomicaceae bacterium]|nr:LysM peptidoglycan-binding domain-containing protein [Crocinitomicaceae bacterium]